MEQLTIFGELIGGSYPHPEVAKIKGATRVQKGVFYAPQNLFLAFDILINNQRYLSVDEANYYFEKHDLLHAKTLFRGSIDECLAYPNEFDSTIPEQLGLPLILPNICEGVVIRPVEPIFFHNGSRLLLKNKNEKWAEKKQFKTRIRKEEPLPERVVKLKEAILTYATENRLDNVLSKVGEVNHKDIGKVLGLFSKDIVEDFTKDYAELYEALEKKEQKMITKSIVKASANMVRERLIYL